MTFSVATMYLVRFCCGDAAWLVDKRLRSVRPLRGASRAGTRALIVRQPCSTALVLVYAPRRKIMQSIEYVLTLPDVPAHKHQHTMMLSVTAVLPHVLTLFYASAGEFVTKLYLGLI
jgi:hypothetical protein